MYFKVFFNLLIYMRHIGNINVSVIPIVIPIKSMIVAMAKILLD